MPRVFGHIEGHPEGRLYDKRRQVHDAGVHRPLIAGISGTADEGADSIVVSGGYPDDEDYGDTIIYTGHGGRDANTGKQVEDQDINAPGNAGLLRSHLEGLPVRVVRGAHKDAPPHAPRHGYRYDGLYQVESYGAKVGREGFRIWQFTLVKLGKEEISAPPAAPAEPSSKRIPGPAPVTTTTVQRIVRNSSVVQQVKAWHENRCQVCGLTIEIGRGVYSEGAHIRGLGKPHHGPDVEENVLCLCPNDHVRFDNGAIYLSDDLKVMDGLSGSPIASLRTHPHHQIGVAYIAYHRAQWTSGIPRANS
ncbi:YDG/SRA domain-containing protein [Nonomuraea fuscirosea]|uniref:YDG/SRA domain-containing protein n=1 Tax=Nonomuraea fuscirosea TaxID=1291556 RepID=UPI00371BDB2C